MRDDGGNCPGDLAGALYDAAAGDLPWPEVGRRAAGLVGARTSSLWVADPASGALDVLDAVAFPRDLAEAYARRHHRLDPWLAAFRARAGRPAAVVGAELVPDAELLRSEFYNDFARRAGIFHLAAAAVPLGEGAGTAVLALHRPHRAGAFGDADLRRLDALAPHLRRALLLRRRLALAEAGRFAGFAALDALGAAATVADAEGRVLFANAAAEALARDAEGGLRLGARGALGAARPDDEREFLRLVRDAAAGGTGGLLGLRRRQPGPPPLAALVAPAPKRYAGGLGGAPPGRPPGGLALVLLKDAEPRRRPDPGRLARLFALTPAEAGVAALLAAGMTAEAVSAARGTSLNTVRTQVRAVLAKSGAANLRDFERLVASLPGPRA